MKNLLYFEEMETSYSVKRKTKIFKVFSNHSKDLLGLIHWRSGWRCYVISYEKDIDMSLSCSLELCKFIQDLENKRKDKIKELSNSNQSQDRDISTKANGLYFSNVQVSSDVCLSNESPTTDNILCKYCAKAKDKHHGKERFCYESDYYDKESEYAEKFEPQELSGDKIE